MSILKAALVATYAIVAVLTFQGDRRVVAAGCWKAGFNQTMMSSVMFAVTWPIGAVLIGTLSVASAEPIPQYVCAASAQLR